MPKTSTHKPIKLYSTSCVRRYLTITFLGMLSLKYMPKTGIILILISQTRNMDFESIKLYSTKTLNFHPVSCNLSLVGISGASANVSYKLQLYTPRSQ